MRKDLWEKLIQAAVVNRPQPVQAHTDLKWRRDTFSKPVALRCNDDKDYVVKGARPNSKRAIFTESVVARLGRRIDAPVPNVSLVEVSAELIKLFPPPFNEMPSGLAHGSEMVPDASEQAVVQHVDVSENRPRFARLSILYGWAHAGDRQLIYNTSKPFLVHSVDHGHFFHGGPIWTEQSLQSNETAQPFPEFVQQCKLSVQEIRDWCPAIFEVTKADIANAVAAPPDDWGISPSERVAVARYLDRRRIELVQALN